MNMSHHIFGPGFNRIIEPKLQVFPDIGKMVHVEKLFNYQPGVFDFGCG
jgi:hypothetical protein